MVRYGKQFRVPRCRLEERLGGPSTWPLPTPPVSPKWTAQLSFPSRRAERAVVKRSTGRLLLAIES